MYDRPHQTSIAILRDEFDKSKLNYVPSDINDDTFKTLVKNKEIHIEFLEGLTHKDFGNDTEKWEELFKTLDAEAMHKMYKAYFKPNSPE